MMANVAVDIVPARLHHCDACSCLGQHVRYHAAACAGTDDDHIKNSLIDLPGFHSVSPSSQDA